MIPYKYTMIDDDHERWKPRRAMFNPGFHRK